MDDPASCGQGLAAHAPLPAALGRLTAATAAVLSAHLPMLDAADPRSEAERAVYAALIEAHERAGRQLHAIAERMRDARTLPMGRHVDAPGANAAMGRAFAELVESEAALHALLAERLVADRAMLDAMHGDDPAPRGAM